MEEEEANEESNMSFRMFIPVTITWLCIVTQIILTFVLWDNFYDLDFLVYIGYVFWGLGAIFGVIPIIQFKMQGGVKKGESYIKTTKVVSTGLYAIVRHPQYLAGIIISIALAFISQYWIVDVLVIPTIICTYIDTFNEDKRIIMKFGEEYKEYMRKVPRLEPISGTLRWIIRKIRENQQKKNQ
ncbi:MAG: isoprenylcysteine carboxylmethyltransferase family protein [Candidatus Heimdallarchaeota archaeon]|nr:isoprenylcysteine carboxylmethyltransferase family protein [Candidatus Heimdallarchaeota archaeon]